MSYFLNILVIIFTALNMSSSTSSIWGGDVLALEGKIAMMPIPLSTADFMVFNWVILKVLMIICWNIFI